CPSISVGPGTLPNGTNGVPYNQNLSASGGTAPYSFTFSGSLPAGLNLSSAGVLSGTPTTAGPNAFTVTVKDTNNCSANTNYTLTIVNPPLLIACPADISVTASSGTGAAVTFNPTVSGGCNTPPSAPNCNPPSGNTFPVGTTAVACSVGDSCGQ